MNPLSTVPVWSGAAEYRGAWDGTAEPVRKGGVETRLSHLCDAH